MEAEAQKAVNKAEFDRRTVWKDKYEANSDLLKKVTEDIPENIREKFDLNDIRVAQWLIDSFREKHETPTEPAKAAADAKAFIDRVAELEKKADKTAEDRQKLMALYQEGYERNIFDERGKVVSRS